MTRKKILKAICGAPDKPLKIGDVEIPCYVLEDETRVLTQTGVIYGVGMSRGGKTGGGDRFAKFMGSRSIKPFISNELLSVTNSPILFISNGTKAYGYPATIINDICEAVLKAREEGTLLKQQYHIAKHCEILVRGLARVGIITLIDEVTGYQRIRGENELAKILKKFIAEELQEWTKTFPIDFYKEIFRLKGWVFEELPNGRHPPMPSVIGKVTNQIVYERLAPGVLNELKEKNPILPKGYRKSKHHQWLTPDLGHPRLKEHIAGVMALMKATNSWREFSRALKRAYPKYGDKTELDLPYPDED